MNIEEKRIKEMISDFVELYNFNLQHSPLEARDYFKWPELFKEEERDIAYLILDYVRKENNTSSSGILFGIGLHHKEKILEKILSNIPLHKA